MTLLPRSLTRRAALGLVAACALLASCGGGGSKSTPEDYNTQAPGSVMMSITHRVTITVSLPDTTGVNLATIDQAAYNALPLVSKTIKIGLDSIHAPISTANFLAYLNSGAYTGTIFHRVIPGFVAQAGGYKMENGSHTHITTQAAIALESHNGLSNTRGTLAMARTTEPNSATSEFFFNLVNNTGPAPFFTNLNWQSDSNPGYAVFGTVMDQASLDVLAYIASLPASGSAANPANWPYRDITITAITID